MLIGFCAYSLRFSTGFWHGGGRMTALELLDIARKIGADGVMFDLPFVPEPLEENLKEVARRAREMGLFVEVETGGTDPEHLREAIDASVALGSSVLRTFVGGGLDRYRAGFEAWQMRLEEAGKNLREVEPYARKRGVKIAIENHGDVRTDELLRLVEGVGSEWIGVCLDTGNPLFLLEDPLAVAKQLAPLVFSTHIKAYRAALCTDGMVVEGCTLFDDDVPNREIVALLRKRSPLGNHLHLNLEVAFERIVVPIFDDVYLKALGEVSFASAMKALRYAKGKWAGGVEELTYSQELPRLEMARLKESVRRAREAWR